MSLNKKKMVREIGRRTRIRNRDVQAVIEALIDVWTEELVSGGRIELEGFCVLEAQQRDRGKQPRLPHTGNAPPYIRRIVLRVSKQLKNQINQHDALA